MRKQIELDSFRWLGTVIARMGGAKKIKRPSDMMKLPLIDGEKEKATFADMVAFLRQEKAK